VNLPSPAERGRGRGHYFALSGRLCKIHVKNILKKGIISFVKTNENNYLCDEIKLKLSIFLLL